MSSRKTPTSPKPSEIVERRISQLFKDIRDASGNVLSNNQDEAIPEKKTGYAGLEKNLSLAFSEAFSDRSLIPPPEPDLTPPSKEHDSPVYSVVHGAMFTDNKVEAIRSLEDEVNYTTTSSYLVSLSSGIDINPEKMLIQVPIPFTNMAIYCEAERRNSGQTWDENDLTRMKSILTYLEELLRQRFTSKKV